MKMSGHGKKKITEWEGFEPQVYDDSAGNPTSGVGHLLTPSELSSGKINIQGESVSYADGLTEAQVLDLLGQDMEGAEDVVNASVEVDLTQNRFDALVSFCFNVGDSGFRNSTLLKLLNQGKYEAVPGEMRKWVKATVNGQKVTVQGLVNRREHEIALWSA